jgi:hypothetical protein
MSTVEPARSRADEHTWEALRRGISSEIAGKPLHRSGTAYVPADLPDLESVLGRLKSERRPVVLVHDDGTEQVIDRGEDDFRRAVMIGLLVVAGVLLWDVLKGGQGTPFERLRASA